MEARMLRREGAGVGFITETKFGQAKISYLYSMRFFVNKDVFRLPIKGKVRSIFTILQF